MFNKNNFCERLVYIKKELPLQPIWDIYIIKIYESKN